MQHPLPDLGAWPTLDFESWRETLDTLHMCTQIVGKTRLALTALQNHWWNVALQLTARGLTTRAMPAEGGVLLDVEFDFVAHEVICRNNRGEIGRIALKPVAVAQFYKEYFATLASLGVALQIDPKPVEVANPIRCDLDTVHCSYDGEAVGRWWRAVTIAQILLERFSTNFYGKISPVHFFWGSFDLAVTRFNGKRRAPAPAPAPAAAKPGGADAIQAEAYSHEVISAGFWPGNGGYGRAAFYAYAAPVPEGLERAVLPGRGGFNKDLGEFILDYEAARSAADPVDAVLEFLEESYAACATAARWDRANLDRTDEIGRAVRLKRSQHTRGAGR